MTVKALTLAGRSEMHELANVLIGDPGGQKTPPVKQCLAGRARIPALSCAVMSSGHLLCATTHLRSVPGRGILEKPGTACGR